jgi:hypothetical protein
MLAGVIGNHGYGILLTYGCAEEAVFAIFHILKYRLLLFFIPSYNVYETCLVA